MSFEITKSFKYLESAISARAIKQDLIAGNIANADTPYYRPRDLDFETALSKKAAEEFGNKTTEQKLELAKTDSKMMDPVDDFDPSKPTIYIRDGHLARNDGNSVDLDVETTELSKNNMMYNSVIEALKKETQIFKAVISASKNI
jgi:flagellar basal-body rod protein FlgB